MEPVRIHSPIICAVDTPSLDQARRLAGQLVDIVGALKIGLEFFSAHGPEGVRTIAEIGPPLFLDLKLHDIPNTVASAVRAIVPLQPAFVTVHASGGREMLSAAATAARETAADLDLPRPRLLAVTVLTSLDDDDLRDVGQDTASGPPGRPPGRRWPARPVWTASSVLPWRSSICAPVSERNSRSWSRAFGRPGRWADDQKRILTPAGAVSRGADYLVIGRPITRATDPVAAARRIADELLPA